MPIATRWLTVARATCPYFDRRVAEFAWSLPPQFLYRGGITKSILRDTVVDLAPAEVLARRDKVGFETPQRQWMHEPQWVARVADVLLDDTARARNLYETAAIDADVRAGRWRDVNGVWWALNLGSG